MYVLSHYFQPCAPTRVIWWFVFKISLSLSLSLSLSMFWVNIHPLLIRTRSMTSQNKLKVIFWNVTYANKIKIFSFVPNFCIVQFWHGQKQCEPPLHSPTLSSSCLCWLFVVLVSEGTGISLLWCGERENGRAPSLSHNMNNPILQVHSLIVSVSHPPHIFLLTSSRIPSPLCLRFCISNVFIFYILMW